MVAIKTPLVASVLFLTCCLLSGCGGSPRVEGTVTFNGEKVDGGVINFFPAAQAGGAAKGSARIIGGRYSIASSDMPAGSYLVRITWSKKTGKQIDNPSDPGVKMDQMVQVIPKQYNSESNVTKDVTSGSNTINFELTGTAISEPLTGPGAAGTGPRTRIKD